MLFGNLLDVNHQTDNRRNKRQCIRYRHTNPDTFQSPPVGKEQQARQKIKQLPRQRKENTYFSLPDTLEEVTNHNLRPYKREHQYSQPDTVYGQINLFIAIREKSRYGMREELADNKPATGNHDPGDNPQSQCLFHTVYLLRSEVIPHNRLHTHRQT